MEAIKTQFVEIEPNHTIKTPEDWPVGERVMIVRFPPLRSLLNDPERRERFLATRRAIKNAIHDGFPHSSLSNKEIVTLVKRARQAHQDT